MIHLKHFIPLQTTLMASYSRLHALIVVCLDVVQSNQPSRVRSPAPQVVEEESVLSMEMSGDLGELVQRNPEASVYNVPAAPEVVVKPAAQPPVKQKKRKKDAMDAMDDIFGI